MCCDNLLCETVSGKVYNAECSDCGEIFVVMFNNVVLVHDEEGYRDLVRKVRGCYDANVVASECAQPSGYVVFQTNSNSIKLSFSLQELRELNYLLETAYMESVNL